MASYEEYAAKYLKEEASTDLTVELGTATAQETARPEGATNDSFEAPAGDTPNIDWEQRYNELQKLNSRQAQDLGNYRKMVDEYINTDSTPTPDEPVEEVQPITADDLYDNPEEAVRRAVDSHPDIVKARELTHQMEAEAKAKELSEFQERHSDYTEIVADPAFKNWVFENQTRLALAQTADQGDLTSADALFSLYKAEKGIAAVNANAAQEAAITNASLESPHGSEPLAPDTYSRSEMLSQKIRAKQGDMQAEAYVNQHAAKYREALASGNVRD